ncbi:hypothetical protein D3C79_870880 [compost metagenome]
MQRQGRQDPQFIEDQAHHPAFARIRFVGVGDLHRNLDQLTEQRRNTHRPGFRWHVRSRLGTYEQAAHFQRPDAADRVNVPARHPDPTAGRHRPLAQSRVHHHHAFDGVDQLVGLMRVRFDHPVFRVVGGAAAHGAGAPVDLPEEFIQRLDHDALFAIVDSRIARDRQSDAP